MTRNVRTCLVSAILLLAACGKTGETSTSPGGTNGASGSAGGNDPSTRVRACGDIHVRTDSFCERTFGGECLSRCSASAFGAACAAKGYAACDETCATSDGTQVDVVECRVDCEKKCDTHPEFDCYQDCTADGETGCEVTCTAEMGGPDAVLQCRAECKAKVSHGCAASCEDTPAGCSSASCAATCNGKLDANAAMRCDIECHAPNDAACRDTLEDVCTSQCGSNGAVYCDGQYVNAGTNVQACITALNAILDADIEVKSPASEPAAR